MSVNAEKIMGSFHCKPDAVVRYMHPSPVTYCEGCGRPLFIPHIDVPGIRCHWCSDNAIAYRVPR